MKISRKVPTIILLMLAFLILIIDAKTAYTGAVEGINLCLKTIIPILFPFIVLSRLLGGYLLGSQLPILKPIAKLCHIPYGAESILLLGFLGGYPVGAQCINDAYEQGVLSKKDSTRMLAFCNNAGPSFIFGLCASLFDSLFIPFILWVIHIVSALIVGFCTKSNTSPPIILNTPGKINLPKAVDKGIKVTAAICGWVILFRIIITFLQNWFLWLMPLPLQNGIIGMLEISNGCCNLFSSPIYGQRFVMCAFILGFGGLCVAMQTATVAKSLYSPLYIQGKILHAFLSFLFASVAQLFLFADNQRWHLPFIVYFSVTVFFVIILIFFRKNSRFSDKSNV